MQAASQPTVSVLLPVFNAEKFISDAIKSILAQTFTDFELILINDGSSDSSPSIIVEYAKKDPRIVVINNLNNLGLIETLNLGLNAAKGRYIARMDADDISAPDRFAYQVDYLEKNHDIFLIGGSFYLMDENGRLLRKKQKEYFNDQISKKILKFGVIHHPTVMFRNEDDIFYRKKAIHCEDRDLWLRFISEGKKLYVSPKILLYYRVHEQAISSINPETQKAVIQQLVKWHKQRLTTGTDDYESVNIETIVRNESDGMQNNLKRKIKLLFLSDIPGGEVKEKIKEYWNNKKRGGTWFASIGLYSICLLPENISQKIRKSIRKIWE